MDRHWPGSSVLGILQARTLEWVAMPSSGDFPNPGMEPASLTSSALAGGFFTVSTTWVLLVSVNFGQSFLLCWVLRLWLFIRPPIKKVRSVPPLSSCVHLLSLCTDLAFVRSGPEDWEAGRVRQSGRTSGAEQRALFQREKSAEELRRRRVRPRSSKLCWHFKQNFILKWSHSWWRPKKRSKRWQVSQGTSSRRTSFPALPGESSRKCYQGFRSWGASWSRGEGCGIRVFEARRCCGWARAVWGCRDAPLGCGERLSAEIR